MTDTDSIRESLSDGVALEYDGVPGGKIRLAVFYEDTPIHSSVYNLKIFGSDTLKGQFVNAVVDALEAKSGVDTDSVAVALQEWFAEMHELDKEEQREKLLPDHIQEMLDGTHSVEIYGGETTTWQVTLTYAGRTRELEFTASEMVADSGGALEEKLANQFFEVVEVGPAEWKAIRENWQEWKEVVGHVEETADDTIAGRVLEYISHNVLPVAEREKLANSNSTAWYDRENTTGSEVAGTDESILWIHDSFLVDQLEQAGKNLEYKSKLIQTLNQRGDLLGAESDGRKRWPNPQGKDRSKFYPFKPEAVGVDSEDIGEGNDPSHSEVEA